MNAKQTARIQYLTDSITRASQFTTRDGWINGPVVFSVEQHGDNLWFSASSATDELKWFEQPIFVHAIIGKNGGCRVYTLKNLSLYALGRVTTNTLRQR